MSCSFCASNLHNINRCMDPMIDLLYERIKVIYVDILTQHQHDAEVRFKSTLNRRFNMRELRGVGVKFMSSVTRLTKRELIQKNWEYFSSHIHLPENEPRRLPVQPDPIPEFARDLEQQQDDEEEDITWYIDRTPSRVNIQQNSYRNPSRVNIQQNSYRNPTSVTAIPSEPQAPQRFIVRQFLEELYRQGDRVRLHEYHNDLMSYLAFSNTSGSQEEIFEIRDLLRITQHYLDNVTVRKFNIIPELLVQEDENLEECDDCPICYDSVKLLDSVKIGCGHKFCGECVTQTLKKHNKRDEPCCALCRGKIESCVVKNQEVYDKIVEYCNFVN